MPSRRTSRRRTRSLDRDTSVAGLPVVAIVGRPNVGKSTLFNRLIGERRAIVEDRARTTRDRLYGVTEWNDRRYVVIDTGGMEVNPGDAIEERVQDQARLAIEEADVIVFVVDAATGLTPADQEVAEILRLASSPVVMAVNKADNEKLELQGAEFLRLGWLDSHAVSALHGRGTGDLLDAIVVALPEESGDELGRKAREARAAELAELVEEGLVPGLLGEDVEAFDAFEGLGARRRTRGGRVGRAGVRCRAATHAPHRHRGPPQRGQVVAAQPAPGRGARHRQRHPGHHARRHRHDARVAGP